MYILMYVYMYVGIYTYIHIDYIKKRIATICIAVNPQNVISITTKAIIKAKS